MSSLVTNVHLDILKGKDESLDLADVLISAKEESLGRVQSSGDMHLGMERMLNI